MEGIAFNFLAKYFDLLHASPKIDLWIGSKKTCENKIINMLVPIFGQRTTKRSLKCISSDGSVRPVSPNAKSFLICILVLCECTVALEAWLSLYCTCFFVVFLVHANRKNNIGHWLMACDWIEYKVQYIWHIQVVQQPQLNNKSLSVDFYCCEVYDFSLSFCL